MRSCRLLAVALLLFSNLCVPAWAAGDDTDPTKAPDAPLNERVIAVPGDPDRPVMLQVTVYTPPGPGPFPLAIMNHGAPQHGETPAQTPRYRYTMAAYYFLSRGYAVALPMMRGFAGSGGSLQPHGCDFARLGLDDAKDIRAVVSYMVRQPGIDGSRIVVAGQSYGGWNTLAFGTLGYPGVKGLVSFAGGVTESDCPTADKALAAAAAQLGAAAKLPSIWFFGDNDSIFAPPLWHEMYRRYTEAGGPAELVAYGSFNTDSHQFLSFPEALPLWVPKLDAFLARIGLPGAPVHPEYLPAPLPKPTGFAAIDDVSAVPYINDDGRQAYRKFLTEPIPAAFLIAPTGSVFAMYGGIDPLGRGLRDCAKAGQVCRPYAIDHDVVWVRPTPEPRPTGFAPLADANAVPFLTPQGRQGYEKFLTLRRPRAFAIAPDGAWIAAAGGADPLAGALDACSKRHRGCGLYAVDSDVVWPAAAGH